MTVPGEAPKPAKTPVTRKRRMLPPPDATELLQEPKIRCTCPHCNKVLGVPESMIGQVVNCPNCKAEFSMPDGSDEPEPQEKDLLPEEPPAEEPAYEEVEERKPKQPSSSRSSPVADEPKMRCACPHCNRVLRIPHSLGGQVTNCPGCKKAFTVPDAPSTMAASKPASASAGYEVVDEPPQPAPDEPKIRCRCPHCNRILKVPQSLAGQTSNCPGCNGAFSVPNAAPEPAESAGFEVVESMPPPEEAKIRCRCPHCNRILKVPATVAGTVSTCPGCNGRFNVPKEMAEPDARPVSGPEERRTKRRKRRRYYDDDDDFEPKYRGSYQRGKVISMICGIILLLITGLALLGAFLLGGVAAAGAGKADPARMAGFICGAVIGSLVRAIGAIGLMMGKRWARNYVGILLIICGLFNVVAVVLGNLWTIIDVVINFGIAITVLVSSSVGRYCCED
jgi:DNA-directed RNA polymerase subunit M/transcription elongation factor TFIIS